MNGTEVVATTAEPAFAVDSNGRILAWNPAAEHCLGYRQSEVVGRDCWTVLRGRDRSLNRYCNESCPLRSMALRREPIHRTEMFLRNGCGEMVRASMSILVVSVQQGSEIVHLFQLLPAVESEASLPPADAIANHNARLSARQLEVLRLLADGRTTGEIAEMLCISTATVRHHIQIVLRRLKVHSRLAAVILATRIGLI